MVIICLLILGGDGFNLNFCIFCIFWFFCYVLLIVYIFNNNNNYIWKEKVDINGSLSCDPFGVLFYNNNNKNILKVKKI